MEKKSNRILTGIQSTGTPHLGNILGAIIPAIQMSQISESYIRRRATRHRKARR